MLGIVRPGEETSSYCDPSWNADINALGGDLDTAMNNVVGDKTLMKLLDALEDQEVASICPAAGSPARFAPNDAP